MAQGRNRITLAPILEGGNRNLPGILPVPAGLAPMSLVPPNPTLSGGATSAVVSDNADFAEYIMLQMECANLESSLLLHDRISARFPNGILAAVTRLDSDSLPLPLKVQLWRKQREGLLAMLLGCSDQPAAIATGPAAPGQPPAAQNSGDHAIAGARAAQTEGASAAHENGSRQASRSRAVSRKRVRRRAPCRYIRTPVTPEELQQWLPAVRTLLENGGVTVAPPESERKLRSPRNLPLDYVACPDVYFQVCVAANMVARRPLLIADCEKFFEALYPHRTGYKTWMRGENNVVKRPRFSIRHVWNAAGVQILPKTEALHSVVFPIWRKRRTEIYGLLSEWIVSTACQATHAPNELVRSAVDYMRSRLTASEEWVFLGEADEACLLDVVGSKEALRGKVAAGKEGGVQCIDWSDCDAMVARKLTRKRIRVTEDGEGGGEDGEGCGEDGEGGGEGGEGGGEDGGGGGEDGEGGGEDSRGDEQGGEGDVGGGRGGEEGGGGGTCVQVGSSDFCVDENSRGEFMANISSDWEPARAQPATLEAAAAAAAADAQPLVTEAVAGALTRVSDARTPLAVPAGLPGGGGGAP